MVSVDITKVNLPRAWLRMTVLGQERPYSVEADSMQPIAARQRGALVSTQSKLNNVCFDQDPTVAQNQRRSLLTRDGADKANLPVTAVGRAVEPQGAIAASSSSSALMPVVSIKQLTAMTPAIVPPS